MPVTQISNNIVQYVADCAHEIWRLGKKVVMCCKDSVGRVH